MITTAELHELRTHMTPRFLLLIDKALGATEAQRIRGEIYRAAGSSAPGPAIARAAGGLAGGSFHVHGIGGMVRSATPGRADAIRTSVPRGSYIIPADVVSAQGQGNSLAGAASYKSMVAAVPRKRVGAGYAAGGAVAGLIPVKLSGGEFHVPPHVVEHIGKGDIQRGSKILDSHVAAVRRKNVQTVSRLPPPKR